LPRTAGAGRTGVDLARRPPGLADRPSQAHVRAAAALAFAAMMKPAKHVNIDPDASLPAAFGEVERAARQAHGDRNLTVHAGGQPLSS